MAFKKKNLKKGKANHTAFFRQLAWKNWHFFWWQPCHRHCNRALDFMSHAHKCSKMVRFVYRFRFFVSICMQHVPLTLDGLPAFFSFLFPVRKAIFIGFKWEHSWGYDTIQKKRTYRKKKHSHQIQLPEKLKIKTKHNTRTNGLHQTKSFGWQSQNMYNRKQFLLCRSLRFERIKNKLDQTKQCTKI